MSGDLDVVIYSGEINSRGYDAVCNVLQNKKSESALLVLATPGGNPHSGFRIARALQHTYGKFDALVPRYCKSAGTLILTGAASLFLDDRSELGPLDVQIKKGDELLGRNSGLDIFQAVNYLQAQTLLAFKQYLLDLTKEHGLSTKVASDIAVNLTSNLFSPVSAQIDPIKLAEMQRATEIAFAYGSRLNEKSNNLREGGMTKLVSGYPSHGFVIDRKEAKSIFINVSAPTGFLAEFSKAMMSKTLRNIDSPEPEVEIVHFGSNNAGKTDETNSPNADGSQERPQGSEQSHDGDSENGGPSAALNSSLTKSPPTKHAPKTRKGKA